MHSIITNYHGPTDTRQSRVTATMSGIKGSVSVNYQNELSSMENHLNAAKKMAEKTRAKFNLSGTRKYTLGEAKNGYVFVLQTETVEL